MSSPRSYIEWLDKECKQSSNPPSLPINHLYALSITDWLTLNSSQSLFKTFIDYRHISRLSLALYIPTAIDYNTFWQLPESGKSSVSYSTSMHKWLELIYSSENHDCKWLNSPLKPLITEWIKYWLLLVRSAAACFGFISHARQRVLSISSRLLSV